jgi:hypothetical protein
VVMAIIDAFIICLAKWLIENEKDTK